MWRCNAATYTPSFSRRLRKWRFTIRAYKDEASLLKQYPEYYQSEWFKEHTKADGGKYLSGHEIIWMNPTDYSKLQ